MLYEMVITQALYLSVKTMSVNLDSYHRTKDPDFFSFFAKLSEISSIDPLVFANSISSSLSAMQEIIRTHCHRNDRLVDFEITFKGSAILMLKYSAFTRVEWSILRQSPPM
jgi:hypothetical protein